MTMTAQGLLKIAKTRCATSRAEWDHRHAMWLYADQLVDDARRTYDATVKHRETAKERALQAAQDWSDASAAVTAIKAAMEDPE